MNQADKELLRENRELRHVNKRQAEEIQRAHGIIQKAKDLSRAVEFVPTAGDDNKRLHGAKRVFDEALDGAQKEQEQ